MYCVGVWVCLAVGSGEGCVCMYLLVYVCEGVGEGMCLYKGMNVCVY